ncbi:hypothetical protein HPC49_20220 [Pyxidicoccus fallax]|uniref:Uncharacterized protein n=1 Tax=Pyxidicoccus fallax TaxID=394095 RepID=A0A848LQA2_9BACT|nr:hypothetical protein [Pyxidicoccus fallax]NMO19881.1 hypothetical protein [Pyxidicoccus fallax]NPC80538.1 hypothetical protein [Pyxidicoccus fallax]
MNFSLTHVDIDCGLGNPFIAVAVGLGALLFGAWMALVLRSRRSIPRKALYLGGILAGSVIGSWCLQALALMAMTLRSHGGHVLQVGCIESPPAFVGPVATLGCAVLLFAALSVWHRARRARAAFVE